MAKKKIEKMTLTEQANEVLVRAQEKGIETNFFFLTTFKRYQVQMKIMNDLEKAINQDGALVTKEYVKGRENIYTNPAITEYNKTATAANNTVATLIKIVQSLGKDDQEKNAPSKLEELLKSINNEAK